MVAMRSLMTRRSKRGSGKGSMHRLNMQSHMQGRHLFWNFSIQLCKKNQVGKCLRSQRNTTVMQQALQLCQLLLSVVSGFLTPTVAPGSTKTFRLRGKATKLPHCCSQGLQPPLPWSAWWSPWLRCSPSTWCLLHLWRLWSSKLELSVEKQSSSSTTSKICGKLFHDSCTTTSGSQHQHQARLYFSSCQLCHRRSS